MSPCVVEFVLSDSVGPSFKVDDLLQGRVIRMLTYDCCCCGCLDAIMCNVFFFMLLNVMRVQLERGLYMSSGVLLYEIIPISSVASNGSMESNRF